jgi:hypothetical protein
MHSARVPRFPIARVQRRTKGNKFRYPVQNDPPLGRVRQLWGQEPRARRENRLTAWDLG